MERLLLGHIRKLIVLITEDEDRFTQLVLKQSKCESDKTVRNFETELHDAQDRLSRIDEIQKRLYEDNLNAKITDEMLKKMLISYVNEQAQLNARAKELDCAIHEAKDNTANVTYMISLAHQYEEPVEFTAKIIREFRVIDGTRKQRVRIFNNGIGELLLLGQSQILSTR